MSNMCIPDSSSKLSNEKSSKAPPNWGVTLGSISVFVSLLGGSMTIPFLQSQRDSLGCDALCYGTMQSARSGLTLVGSVFVGRLSDRLGRKSCLYIGLAASLLSYAISVNFNSLDGMRMAMIPSSLLNQNFNVLKALFADYNAGGIESERASALGRLGMAVGISFMIGPVIGTTFLSNYRQANLAALCLTLVAGIFLYLLPEPQIKRSPSQNSLEADLADSAKKEKGGILSFLYLPAAQTPGARLLFFMRCGMALAFNIFMTIWTVSLKQRFNFAPRDHAFFMGWVGLCYALSQGVLAKLFIKMSGEDPTIVLLICVAGLSVGRVFAMLTTSIVMVYLIMAGVIVALGVMNTAMASACSRLADADQVGGLFGVMEAVESSAGLVGPALGGILFRMGPNVPLVTVVGIYSVVFVAIFLYYRDTIVYRKKKIASPLAATADVKLPSEVQQRKVESKKKK